MTVILQFTKSFNLYEIEIIKMTPKEHTHLPNAFSNIFYVAYLISLDAHTNTVLVQIHINVTKLDIIMQTETVLLSVFR
jgi:hypothetical protein